ncbi:unnamed protein product [Staurois parvus]|uniref:Uncharacterized protein n=1 Tax=Staurois parvus TaxID=386267 RepID=A0ABN9DE50_9NEOB|nr:unnamed protein product [Staurois parvus]
MQMSAVDLRITAHFHSFGQSQGPKPVFGATGVAVEAAANGRPYSKL